MSLLCILFVSFIGGSQTVRTMYSRKKTNTWGVPMQKLDTEKTCYGSLFQDAGFCLNIYGQCNHLVILLIRLCRSHHFPDIKKALLEHRAI